MQDNRKQNYSNAKSFTLALLCLYEMWKDHLIFWETLALQTLLKTNVLYAELVLFVSRSTYAIFLSFLRYQIQYSAPDQLYYSQALLNFRRTESWDVQT